MIGIRMNMPKSCPDCRFKKHFPGTKYYGCTALPDKEFHRDCRTFRIEEYFDSRPKWCPLEKLCRKVTE